MKKLLFLLGIAMIFLATNCSEETKTDIRDTAVGTYSGTTAYYAVQNGELVSLKEIFPNENTSINVTKDAVNSNIIKLTNDGETLNGKVAEGSNGFTFDIEEQTFQGTKISGYNFAKLGNISYNGVFLSDKKQISFGFKISASAPIFDDETKESLSAMNVTEIIAGVEVTKK